VGTDTAIFVISGLSAFFDLTIRKIPNWLIACGLLLGVALNALQGYAHLFASVSGFVVGVGVLFLPFAMGWIGAGDVKFFGVVGALVGIWLLPRVFFYSSLVAGIIAVVYLVADLASISRLNALWLNLKVAFLSLGRVLPEPVYVNSRGSTSVPWGVAFAAGTMIAYYLDSTGQWAGF
jgi:prepilin peptidase CpaA